MDYTGAYTVMCWAYMSVTGSESTIFSISDGSLNSFDIIGHNNTGTTVRLVSRTGGGGPSQATGGTLTANTWHHFALRRNSATSIEVFLDGVSVASNTLNASTRPSETIAFLGRQVAVTTVPLNGRVAGYIDYNTAVTTAQIRAQMSATRPLVLANILNFAPILAGSTGRTRAYIGDDWTENGTLSDEAPPPVGWGNSVISNPFVVTSSDLIVNATTDTLAIADFNASIDHPTNTVINATLDTISISDFNALTNISIIANASTDSMVIADFNATIQTDTNINATTDALTIADFNATITALVNQNINATLDTLSITDFNASITALVDTTVNATLDTILITDFIANVQIGADTVVNATTDNLFITNFNATVTALDSIVINATLDTLTIGDFNASIIHDTSTIISATLDTLSIIDFLSTVIATSADPENDVKPENISFAGTRTNRANSSGARQSNTSFASRRNT